MSLTIAGLTKTYANGTRALDNISLKIEPGMFGLLGPNGAGKSTFMRTLATLQTPDSGSVILGDIDVLATPMAVRQKLGYLPQEFGVYPGISAERLLSYFALLKGMVNPGERRDCVTHLLQLVNLYDERKKVVSQYSGGMRQRFGIAQALIGDPYLIIVDEPTAGLDPMERGRFNALLNDISQNRLVILSTHIVSDVWDLCPDMAILDQGKLAFHGKPGDAVKALDGFVWEGEGLYEDTIFDDQARILSSRLRHGRPVMRVFSTARPAAPFVQAQPDLQDVYFKALGEAA